MNNKKFIANTKLMDGDVVYI